MSGPVLPLIVPLIERALEEAGADKRQRAAVMAALARSEGELGRAAAEIVAAEARSEGWLTRSWRPLVMINFALLINLSWWGIVPPSMPPELMGRLFDLMALGIGGYVAGRSVEKTALALGARLMGQGGRPRPRPPHAPDNRP